MIDEVDADAPMPGRLFNAVMAANADNYSHFWVRPKTQFGSFKLTVHVETQRMSWKICPMKLLVGHNLFGTNNLARILDGILRAIYQRFGLTFTDKDTAFYAANGVLLSRIDLTGGFQVGSQAMVVETIYLLREHLLDHGFDIVVHEGPNGIETLYLGKKSSTSTLKFYNKYLQMLDDKRLQLLPYYNELLSHAESEVRFEFAARDPYLASRGLKNSKEWTVGKVREILEETLDELGLSKPLLAELPAHEVVGLSDARRAKYTLWLDGNDLKEHYPAHTFARDRTVFLAKGIDIGRPHTSAQDAVLLSETLSVDQLRTTWPKRFVPLGAVYR